MKTYRAIMADGTVRSGVAFVLLLVLRSGCEANGKTLLSSRRYRGFDALAMRQAHTGDHCGYYSLLSPATGR